MNESLNEKRNVLLSNLEIYGLQKDELSCQIDGEKSLLKEKEDILLDIDSQITSIKKEISDNKNSYLDEQVNDFRKEISIFSLIPSVGLGGLVLAFGGVPVAMAALASTVGSYFAISKCIYSNKIRDLKSGCEDRYRALNAYIDLNCELNTLIKQRQALEDEIFEIRYEINRYTNELNILTSKVIYTKSELKDLDNGSLSCDVVDLETLVVRALK